MTTLRALARHAVRIGAAAGLASLGLAALAGSSALLGTSEGGIRGRLRALGAGTAALGRSAWTRVRPNRTAAK